MVELSMEVEVEGLLLMEHQTLTVLMAVLVVMV
jgi:hypothetical protein